MRSIRFAISSLLAIILVLGVGIAALRESYEIWESSLFAFTIGVLLISILLAVHRTEKRRAFWLGFAFFGSAYLGLSLVPSNESRRITTRAFDYLDSKIRDRSLVSLRHVWDTWSSQPNQNNSASRAFSQQFVLGEWTATGNVVVPATGSTMSFIRIGHSLLALIAAIGGGLLSQNLHASNRQPTS